MPLMAAPRSGSRGLARCNGTCLALCFGLKSFVLSSLCFDLGTGALFALGLTTKIQEQRPSSQPYHFNRSISSTQIVSLFRYSAMTMPRPMAASAAATTITKTVKIWPARHLRSRSLASSATSQ
jgi:hypothetical protein